MGTYRTTAAQDYKVTDGTETVTYTAGVLPGTNTAFTIHFADRHAFTRGEVVASNGLYGFGDEEWAFGCDQFPTGVAPQAGDTILDADGVTWTVQQGSTRDDLGVSWFVPARQERT